MVILELRGCAQRLAWGVPGVMLDVPKNDLDILQAATLTSLFSFQVNMYSLSCLVGVGQDLTTRRSRCPGQSLPIRLINFVDDSQVEAEGVGKTSSILDRRCILNGDFAEGKGRVWFSILSLVLLNEHSNFLTCSHSPFES